MSEAGLTRNQMIRELARSPHGKLSEYVPIGRAAALQDPNFFAHLIAWNELHGQVRDAKVALPVIALAAQIPAHARPNGDPFPENALAHLAKLDPRNFVRALDFAREVRVPGRNRALRRLVGSYVRLRESNRSWWDRTALQHRASLKTLYARYHLKPGRAEYQVVLNHRLAKGSARTPMPPGSVFEALGLLPNMSSGEAATLLIEKRIPFLVAVGSIGKRLKEDDTLVLALIEQMTPSELVTNTKMLEKLGLRSRPALRGAYEKALEQVASSKKLTLKTTRAAEAVESEALKKKLGAAQEQQLDSLSIEGTWLVLGDKSGSMSEAIEASRRIAATLARVAKGGVHLVFFDVAPTAIPQSAKTYDELLKATRYIAANGGTSIGCGLLYALDRKIEVDGIAVVSDGAENNLPRFVDVYKRYADLFGEPVVYFYKLRGTDFEGEAFERSMASAQIDLQVFDLRQGSIDYYSLPNLVATMRASRYALADEILATPLLSLKDVFGEAA